jgi:uncharacterized membrane protein YdjX (TVP38/TMEM64 family)
MSLLTSMRPHMGAVALLVIFLSIVLLTVLFPPSEWVPAQHWGEVLESYGRLGMALFVSISILATAVGLPRQMIAFIAGLAYGVIPGLLLSLLAAILGCYLTLRTSKRFLATWVMNRYPAFLQKLDKLLKDDVFAKILVLRLQPFGTNLLTNVCAGFTSIPHGVFLAASAVGFIPQMLVFALLGKGIRVGSQTQLILSVALLLVSLVLGFILYKRHQLRRYL